MQNTAVFIRKFEFEARIFISFTIVLVICLLSFLVFRSVPNNMVIIGNWFGLESWLSLRIGYFFAVAIIINASLLRMWAGSVLTSQRMMAFKIQKDILTTTAPYNLVRNPIYLADLIAFFGFALCLRPIGLAMPVLLYLHYTQLVKYEELTLDEQFGEDFQSYKKSVHRFIPSLSSIIRFLPGLKGFTINFDGFRHNALYILLIPGLVLAAFTGSFVHAIIIGLPAVIDWAIIHTRKGISTPSHERETCDIPAQKTELSEAEVFEDILYAQCWEDPQIDREAFQIRDDDVVFSITSGGCNVLAFLVDNPKKIIALDLNPSQNFLLDLKMAAFKALSYEEMLEFLGILPSKHRDELYKIVRIHLLAESQNYWDQHQEKIINGPIHCGRYEGYMKLLNKWFGRLMGKSLAKELFETNEKSEREILYKKKWNNLRWRIFTRFFLSRKVMTILFDKAFFAQLEESFSFGEHFSHIAKRAVTKLPVKNNHFLAYILLGKFYSLKHLPEYLRKENFNRIRERIDRIELVSTSCEDYFATLPSNCITKFNFSNIFEWMPTEAAEYLLKETIRISKNGSILTYRNLLVPRSRPQSLNGSIKPLAELSKKLHNQDRSFIYRAYVVEQIYKS